MCSSDLVKGFNQEDANWISGGATSFVHVPYMLRLSERALPLRGDLLSSLAPRAGVRRCGGPLECGQTLGGQIVDRALAGFNRLMEQGVEPLARMIWAPRGKGTPNRSRQRSPLREPPITADPMALRELQQEQQNSPSDALTAPLAPDLPPPLLLQDGQQLPADPDATRAMPARLPAPLPALPGSEATAPVEPPPPVLPPPGQP